MKVTWKTCRVGRPPGTWLRTTGFMLKHLDRFVAYFSLHRTLTDRDTNWSHGDYLGIIVMFLSAVWTHSDGTHSLQRIK